MQRNYAFWWKDTDTAKPLGKGQMRMHLTLQTVDKAKSYDDRRAVIRFNDGTRPSQ